MAHVQRTAEELDRDFPNVPLDEARIENLFNALRGNVRRLTNAQLMAISDSLFIEHEDVREVLDDFCCRFPAEHVFVHFCNDALRFICQDEDRDRTPIQQLLFQEARRRTLEDEAN